MLKSFSNKLMDRKNLIDKWNSLIRRSGDYANCGENTGGIKFCSWSRVCKADHAGQAEPDYCKRVLLLK